MEPANRCKILWELANGLMLTAVKPLGASDK